MLALQPSKKLPEKCSPNILPCRINHSGSVKVTKRYWSPSLEKDGTQTAYFRGRKLRGRIVQLPAGYQGIIAESSDHVLSSGPAKAQAIQVDEEDSDDQEEEQEAEAVKILESTATFDQVTVWGHDQLPAADDPFVKGVEEWISFAEAIHGPSNT